VSPFAAAATEALLWAGVGAVLVQGALEEEDQDDDDDDFDMDDDDALPVTV
jgi:hypothetical protein